MPITKTNSSARGARALIAAGASLAAGVSLAAPVSSAAAAAISGASRAKPAPVPSPEYLAPGAKGAAVKQVQRALHLKRTGFFGSTTRAGVIRFQHRHRLVVDGIVGPQTRRALHLRVRILHPAAPTVALSPSTPMSTGSPTSYGGGYSIPSSIVMCESGGNWNAVNSSSGAGGAYQILPSTWAAYGGTGLPQNASPAEQSAIAAKIWAASGSSAWSC